MTQPRVPDHSAGGPGKGTDEIPKKGMIWMGNPKMSRADRKRSKELTQMAQDASTNTDPSTVREAVNELNEIRERYGQVTRES